jgi:hypothetical protein
MSIGTWQLRAGFSNSDDKIGFGLQTVHTSRITVCKIEFGFGRFDDQKRTIMVYFWSSNRLLSSWLYIYLGVDKCTFAHLTEKPNSVWQTQVGFTYKKRIIIA